uniref:Uncharacterized protein n=1 Tax=Chenopodium quinoa TaxID=63459 RepID=A0A803MWD7_CHEQI
MEFMATLWSVWLHKNQTRPNSTQLDLNGILQWIKSTTNTIDNHNSKKEPSKCWTWRTGCLTSPTLMQIQVYTYWKKKDKMKQPIAALGWYIQIGDDFYSSGTERILALSVLQAECGVVEAELQATLEKNNQVIVRTELEAQACENENEVTEINGSSSSVTISSQANDDPMYLKVWEKSKRHKNGKFDDEAEEKFKELRELHEKEIGEKGVDNLTLEEAYVKVLGHRSSYAHGLGKGHLVSSKDGKIYRKS